MTVFKNEGFGEARIAIIGDNGPEEIIIHREIGLNFGDIVQGKITAYHPILKGYFAVTDQGAIFIPTSEKLTEGETVTLKVVKEARMDKDAVGQITGEKPIPFASIGEDMSANDMDELIDEALSPTVPLKNGSCLHIEHTKVCWTIDVDSGKNMDPLNQINTEAVSEIVRQIRLKNMGGLILVDFAGSKRASDKKRLEKQVCDIISSDTLSRVCGWTGAGLLEIKRRRERTELWVACSNNNPINVYYRVRRAIATCRSGKPTVRVSPLVMKYLQQQGIKAKLEPLFDTPTAYFEIMEK